MCCSFLVGSSPAPWGRFQARPTGAVVVSESVGSSRFSRGGARLAADEGEQAGVVLGAGGTALEMDPQPGDRRVRVDASQLRLDVAVEFLEALLAGDFRAARSKQPPERRLEVAPVGHRIVSFVPSASPDRSRPWRSLRRASWSVL